MPGRRRAILVIICVALSAAGVPLEAHPLRRQGRRPAPKLAPRQVTRPAAPSRGTTEVAAGAYLTGEANFAVRGGEHPVIRLGLAPSGVTVVEFPAADEFFAVHPPENGDWVEVEKSPTLKTDHHLVLRAGKDLASEAGPTASISVQMHPASASLLWPP